MALTDLTYFVLGDLVVHEVEPLIGYARDTITLNFAAASTVKMGQVVAKAAADSTYHAAVVADLTTAGTTFAVVFGDGYGQKASFPVAAATNAGAVAFVRGQVVLSDYLIKAVNTQFNTAQIATLKGLLKNQGVIVELAC